MYGLVASNKPESARGVFPKNVSNILFEINLAILIV